ncbi:hypothetical protein WN943_003229 [Citrus x changshan-huyou]
MEILVETIIRNFLAAVDSRHGMGIQLKQNDKDAQDKVSDDANDNEQEIQLEQNSYEIIGGTHFITTDNEAHLGNEGMAIGSSVEMVSQVEKNDKMTHSSGVQLNTVCGDEPYVGQEFESVAAAHAFYNAYGMRLGFITRINYRTRSKRDGSIISQSLVCNKEGYRKPPSSRHEVKSIRLRPPTRVGCKAMISVRKMSFGKWVVTKFVKEHTHALSTTQGQTTVLYRQIVSEDWRVEELTQQLIIERKRSASLRRCLDLLFNHIEEHIQDLSKKIQYIVDNVDKIESEGKIHRNPR